MHLAKQSAELAYSQHCIMRRRIYQNAIRIEYEIQETP
jgi:hypothetical protein